MSDLRRFKVHSPLHKDKHVRAASPMEACKKVAAIVAKKVSGSFSISLEETIKSAKNSKNGKVHAYRVSVGKSGKLSFKAMAQQKQKGGGGNAGPNARTNKVPNSGTVAGPNAGTNKVPNPGTKPVGVQFQFVAERVRLELSYLENMINAVTIEASSKLKSQIDSCWLSINNVFQYLSDQAYDDLQKLGSIKDDLLARKETPSELYLQECKEFLSTLQSQVNLEAIVNQPNNAHLNMAIRTNIPTNIESQEEKFNNCKFVIITYWWGYGKTNRNLQYPCPEDEALFSAGLDAVDNEHGPGTYELMQLRKTTDNTIEERLFQNMITKFENSCNTNGCYYYNVQYDQFAKPGMYQLAINAKPLFINYALNECKLLLGNREFTGVVYIDGDMTVNTFPSIFNIRNVDMMARGWNIDPRSSAKHFRRGLYSFDPYVFETSGGIMFFGDTKPARVLLSLWHKISNERLFQGKADDRILSLIVNRYSLQVPMNIVQLPIEYLWLTDIYGEKQIHNCAKTLKPGDVVGRLQRDISGPIIFEHPGCLTGEERAADQGAASDRTPPQYDRYVTKLINDTEHGGIFYKHIMFEQLGVGAASAQESYDVYLKQISNLGADDDNVLPPYYLEEGYGDLASVVMRNLTSLNIDSANLVFQNSDLQSGEIDDIVEEGDTDISAILRILMEGKDVIFKPKAAPDIKKYVGVLKSTQKSDMEFVCFRGNNNNTTKPKFEYKMAYDPDKPIFFSHKSRILRHLLLMSQSIFQESYTGRKKIATRLSDIFNSSHIFLSLIRCAWLHPPAETKTHNGSFVEVFSDFQKAVAEYKKKPENPTQKSNTKNNTPGTPLLTPPPSNATGHTGGNYQKTSKLQKPSKHSKHSKHSKKSI